MPYGSDLATFLGSDYRFPLDGNANETEQGLNGANSGGIFTRPGICLDVTNCYSTNGTADRIVIPATGTIDAAAGEFGFCGWVQLTDAQLPFCRVFGLGNATNNRSVVLGPGNSVIWECDNSSFVAQRYADRNLAANRPYHFFWRWTASGLQAYLDGVEQTLGSDFAQASVTLNAATPIEVGDPAGTVALGGGTVVLVAPVTCDYNELQFVSGAIVTNLTDQQIFDEMVVKGALAGVTITDQAGLDALADSVRPDEPLNIRVDVAGSISLSADNVTHSPLATCHVHYTGTGTLTWTNTNGSNASIGSAPDGNIVFVNPATLTIEGLISGAEVRIYEDDGVNSQDFGTELAGTETLAGTTFNYPHSGAANTIVVQMIASGYEEFLRRVELGASDQTLTVTPELDENL
ncbi:MAG: hypothetical protein AAF358_13670 [Pseudomonadota bacterium]